MNTSVEILKLNKQFSKKSSFHGVCKTRKLIETDDEVKSSGPWQEKQMEWSGWMDGWRFVVCSLVAPSRSSSVIIIASQCAPRWVNHAFRAAHIEKNNNPRRKQPSLVICRLRFLDSTLVMCSRALQTFTGAIWLWFRNFSKIKIATHKQRMHSGSPTHAK